MIYTNTRTLHHSNLKKLCMKQVQCTVNQAGIFVSDATSYHDRPTQLLSCWKLSMTATKQKCSTYILVCKHVTASCSLADVIDNEILILVRLRNQQEESLFSIYSIVFMKY